MSHSTRNIIIAFIASPGDVADERRVAREVVDELNDSLRAINWQIDLLGWEDTLPGAARPQELINKDVDACHLFIGILWRRWGQPTGEYSSGFEEEFERARKRRKESNPPEIWLSFKQVDSELLKDPGEQLKRVVAFRQTQIELREVLFKEFTDLEDWRAKLRNWLLQYVLGQFNQSQEAAQTEENVSAPQRPTTEGPDLSTLTEDSAVRPAYVQLADIFKALSDKLPTSGDNSETKSVIDLEKAARLNLFSTALISSLYTHEVLDSHLTNYLYLKKEQLEAIKIERDLLFRTIISDQAHVLPGWYWFRDLEQEEIESVLFQTAVLDNEAEIRTQALRILKDARIKPTKEATKKFIRYSLTDKEDGVRLASLQYFGSYGDTDDLMAIQPLLMNENSLVRDGAQLARFRIVARRNINEAFAGLVTPDVSANLTEAFSEFDIESREIENESLTAALSHTNVSIKLFALKELSRRGAISTDNLKQLISHSSKQVKEAAYVELVKREENVDFDQLSEALPDEKNIRSFFYGSSYPSIEPSPTLLAFYGRFTFDELLSKLDYHSANTPLVLKALGQYHFNRISDLIRTNLADDFESLGSQAIERIRVQYSEHADDVIGAFKGLERFIKDGLISAALASLAANGEPTDVELARKYLNSSEDYVRFEAIRIIERFGDASDVEPLLNIFRSSYGNLKKAAFKAAIKLSPGINGAAGTVLESEDPTFVEMAIRAIWNEDKEVVAPLLEPLLYDENAEIRTTILRYIIEKYSKEEMVQLLQKYAGETRYYYNVVCWIDRTLYAPHGISEMFIRKIKAY